VKNPMGKPLPLTLLRVINPCHLHDPNGMWLPDDVNMTLSLGKGLTLLQRLSMAKIQFSTSFDSVDLPVNFSGLRNLRNGQCMVFPDQPGESPNGGCNATCFSLFPDAGIADLLGALDSRNGGEQKCISR
jgi:hypothetical protein